MVHMAGLCIRRTASVANVAASAVGATFSKFLSLIGGRLVRHLPAFSQIAAKVPAAQLLYDE
jgi:hypothetical protein